MSRFYADVRNDRSCITKCGHADGLKAHIRGWTKGIRVVIWYNEKRKTEYYSVYETCGSSDTPTEDKLIHKIKVKQKDLSIMPKRGEDY